MAVLLDTVLGDCDEHIPLVVAVAGGDSCAGRGDLEQVAIVIVVVVGLSVQTGWR